MIATSFTVPFDRPLFVMRTFARYVGRQPSQPVATSASNTTPIRAR